MRIRLLLASLLIAASCSDNDSGMAGDNPLRDAERARNNGDPPAASTDFTLQLPPQPPESMPTEPQTPARQ